MKNVLNFLRKQEFLSNRKIRFPKNTWVNYMNSQKRHNALRDDSTC